MAEDKLTYKAIEDNGGGLHLYVFCGGVCVWAAHDFECGEARGMLTDSIEALKNCFDPRVDFDGGVADPVSDWAVMEPFVDDGRSQVIADEDDVWVNRMGAAGRREFPSNIEMT